MGWGQDGLYLWRPSVYWRQGTEENRPDKSLYSLSPLGLEWGQKAGWAELFRKWGNTVWEISYGVGWWSAPRTYDKKILSSVQFSGIWYEGIEAGVGNKPWSQAYWWMRPWQLSLGISRKHLARGPMSSNWSSRHCKWALGSGVVHILLRGTRSNASPPGHQGLSAVQQKPCLSLDRAANTWTCLLPTFFQPYLILSCFEISWARCKRTK